MSNLSKLKKEKQIIDNALSELLNMNIIDSKYIQSLQDIQKNIQKKIFSINNFYQRGEER